MLGVRAFDLRISVNPRRGNEPWVSHGLLAVPLKKVLKDMWSFLSQYKSEVIVIHAKKGIGSAKLQEGYVKPLNDEETDPWKVAGETVHRQMSLYFEDMLATYWTLAKLPVNESMEDPTIRSLVNIGVRVLYCWEGQQVLCVDLESCQGTPGWSSLPWRTKFGFGPPMHPGQRQNLTGTCARIMEPACLMGSWTFTSSAHPHETIRNVKAFTHDLVGHAQWQRPECVPQTGQVPKHQTPQILYNVEAFITPNEKEIITQQQILRNVHAVFARGEGFTLRSEAERTNYLMLVWMMRKGAQALFSKPSIISLDYISPIIIHRIVEAMQGYEDCGWAIYCKMSGSCWARSLFSQDGQCLEEADVLLSLEEYANTYGTSVNQQVLMLATLSATALFLVCKLLMRQPRPGKQTDVEGKKSEYETHPLLLQAANAFPQLKR